MIEPQRILDSIARERIDHQPLLIRGDHLLRRIFQIENPVVDADYGVDERGLEIEPRFGDDAYRLAEPHQQHLFGLVDREHRAVANDDGGEQHD